MKRFGFTIVELIVVIVAIGILAGVVVIGYGSWQKSLVEDKLKSDLNGAASAMEDSRNFNNDYPDTLPSSFVPSEGVTMSMKSGGGTYCIEAKDSENPEIIFSKKSEYDIQAGPCGNYFTSVEVSNSGACGVSYGKAYCWGNGAGYALGNGLTTNSSTPVEVTALNEKGDVSFVSPGGCGIVEGRLYCWGGNAQGQAGIGTISSTVQYPTAVNTATMKGRVEAVTTAGGGHRCAIASGKAYCWGQNNYGQLGNNATSTASAPVEVDMTNISGEFTQLSTNSQHSCGVAGGRAYCWGSNSYSPSANGNLGTGDTMSYKIPTPVVTTSMTGTVTGIYTSGGATTCAAADGRAYCWGEGAGGALGNGSTTSVSSPVAVTTSLMTGKVTAIAGSCALAEGKVYCWGNNSGRLGNGSTAASYVPVAVDTSTMSGEVSLLRSYGSSTFACAISKGDLYCWGTNNYGQLGIGNTSTATTPVLVPTIP